MEGMNPSPEMPLSVIRKLLSECRRAHSVIRKRLSEVVIRYLLPVIRTHTPGKLEERAPLSKGKLSTAIRYL